MRLVLSGKLNKWVVTVNKKETNSGNIITQHSLNKNQTGQWPAFAYKEGNFGLGKGAAKQKQLFSMDLLCEDRKRMLENVGFQIRPKGDWDDFWNKWYEDVKANGERPKNRLWCFNQ